VAESRSFFPVYRLLSAIDWISKNRIIRGLPCTVKEAKSAVGPGEEESEGFRMTLGLRISGGMIAAADMVVNLARTFSQHYNGAHVEIGEVSELADERDLGSRGATRAGSNPAFPT
jgi:hypothetical protein